MWKGPAHCGWCYPGLALGALRKQAEQASRNKPVTSCLTNFCPCLVSMLDLKVHVSAKYHPWNKLLLFMVCITATEILTNTETGTRLWGIVTDLTTCLWEDYNSVWTLAWKSLWMLRAQWVVLWELKRQDCPWRWWRLPGLWSFRWKQRLSGREGSRENCSRNVICERRIKEDPKLQRNPVLKKTKKKKKKKETRNTEDHKRGVSPWGQHTQAVGRRGPRLAPHVVSWTW